MIHVNNLVGNKGQLHVSAINDPMLRSQHMLEKLQGNNIVESDEESSQFEIDAASSPSIKILSDELLKKNSSILPFDNEDPDKELVSLVSAPLDKQLQ